MENPGVSVAVYTKFPNRAIWENYWLVLMKNTIDVSNNVNLILKTYRCLFY